MLGACDLIPCCVGKNKILRLSQDAEHGAARLEILAVSNHINQVHAMRFWLCLQNLNFVRSAGLWQTPESPLHARRGIEIVANPESRVCEPTRVCRVYGNGESKMQINNVLDPFSFQEP